MNEEKYTLWDLRVFGAIVGFCMSVATGAVAYWVGNYYGKAKGFNDGFLEGRNYELDYQEKKLHYQDDLYLYEPR